MSLTSEGTVYETVNDQIKKIQRKHCSDININLVQISRCRLSPFLDHPGHKPVGQYSFNYVFEYKLQLAACSVVYLLVNEFARRWQHLA